MSATSAQIPIPTGATPTLIAAPTPTGGDSVAGDAVLISVQTGADVYIGGVDVTTSTGFLVVQGGTVGLDTMGDQIYGVVAGATPGLVHVLRVK